MTSTISWLQGADGARGESWNPIRARNVVTRRLGHHCEHVHEGCRFCYAEALNRNRRGLPYGGTGLDFKPGHLDAGEVEVFLDEERLLAPLAWKKPKRIFVESMSDPYGRWVDDRWLHRIRAIQAATPQHTYVELTKRPGRMKAFNNHRGTSTSTLRQAIELGADGAFGSATLAVIQQCLAIWPLRNVMGGPSCSTQADVNAFVPLVLQTKLAKRVVSLEPLLEAVRLDDIGDHIDALRGAQPHLSERGFVEDMSFFRPLDLVIVGLESGSGARPRNIELVHKIVAQCRAAGVACFVKQLGRHPLITVDRGERLLKLRDRKGEDWNEWPEDLRVREFPPVELPAAAAPPTAQRDLFEGATS